MYTIYFRGERCYNCLFLLGAYDLMFEIYKQFFCDMVITCKGIVLIQINVCRFYKGHI